MYDNVDKHKHMDYFQYRIQIWYIFGMIVESFNLC